MDPVYVLFWATMTCYAALLVGRALGWQRALLRGVLGIGAGLVLGWCWMLGQATGTFALLLLSAGAGLIWGAYWWRECFYVGSQRYMLHTWGTALRHWGFPSSGMIVIGRFPRRLR